MQRVGEQTPEARAQGTKTPTSKTKTKTFRMHLRGVVTHEARKEWNRLLRRQKTKSFRMHRVGVVAPEARAKNENADFEEPTTKTKDKSKEAETTKNINK